MVEWQLKSLFLVCFSGSQSNLTHSSLPRLQHVDDTDGACSLACAFVELELVVNQIDVHHVDKTAMIPDDSDMVDVDGTLEHDPVLTAGDARKNVFIVCANAIVSLDDGAV